MKVFIIAGEESGDILGMELISSLRLSIPNLQVYGVGGRALQSCGLKSVFDIKDISIIGFSSVLLRLPKLINRINKTVDEMLKINPDLVITIDSGGFCFRVVSRAKKLGLRSRFVHYVAPSVWAYMEGRAKKVARLYDHLFCVFPFEPKYFEKYGLECTVVGSEIIYNALNRGLSTRGSKIAITLGSRFGEVCRHIDIIKHFVKQFEASEYASEYNLVFPALPQFYNIIKNAFPNYNVVVDDADRTDIFKECSYAIAKSGTNAFEFCISNIPHVVYYKTSFLNSLIVRYVLKVKSVTLANIILNKKIIPELIQEEATGKNIFLHLSSLIKTNGQTQIPHLQQVRSMFIQEKRPVSLICSKILQLINKGS